MAAQYLEAHPEAGPDEVRRALVDWATPGTVTMAGEGALLLYSNLTDAGANVTSPGSGTSAAGGRGGGLSAGAIVGIAVGATAGGRRVLARQLLCCGLAAAMPCQASCPTATEGQL